MTYRLYRLTNAQDPARDGLLLGSFADFDTALAARDEDTVRLFSITGPGQIMQAHHRILGPGAQGAATEHPVSTEIERALTAGDQQLAETRAWLTAIHRSA